jgi:hypothetical protein
MFAAAIAIEVFPEVRHPEHTVDSLQCGVEAGAIVEIALHDLGAEVGERFRAVGLRVARDGADVEDATGEQLTGDAAALGTGGSEYEDLLFHDCSPLVVFGASAGGSGVGT